MVAFISLPNAGAVAEEIWTVGSGRISFHFNTNLMGDLGLTLVDIDETAESPSELKSSIEYPYYSFQVSAASDLRFRVDGNVVIPNGVVGGALRHTGGVTIVDAVSGLQREIREFVIDHSPATYDGSGNMVSPFQLYLRDGAEGSPVTFYLDHPMFKIERVAEELAIYYLNLRIAPDWAAAMERPDLAGWYVGMAEVVVSAEMTGGEPWDGSGHDPVYGGFLDVKLGILDSIQQVGHVGTFPDGTAGVSMATTACNAGDVDVPWEAPMDEDHPVIAMQLYRLKDGRFEQIGVSYLKHGFFALSNSQCTPCQNPSDGTYLGVGCSDTYGVNNNGDRRWLAPRDEVDPFIARWECIGSHFSGGVADCVRRHTGSGHDAVEHRLRVQDADLGDADATYYYEAYYVVEDDDLRHNNIGSRRCTVQWTGSVWDFDTPGGNPLVEGPAIERWGDVRTWASIGPNDGDVLLAVETTDLGGGGFHYEYALYNFDSEREIRSFSVPVGSAAVTNMGFHDWDDEASNEWQVMLDGGVVTWETDTFASDPDANALSYGLLFNFRFDADAPPQDSQATLGMFKPGADGDEISAATKAPAAVVAVEPSVTPQVARLAASRPNPFHAATTIGFELARREAVTLDVFDATGRRVRTLVDAELGAGPHEVSWDALDADRERVAAGVYYYRLTAGAYVAARSMVLLDGPGRVRLN
jgi:hypothetical protein